MTVKELAQKYYPRLWPEDRLQALVMMGKLSPDEVEEIKHRRHDGGEPMTVKELAQKYYPRLWPEDRLQALVMMGKLSPDEVEEIKARVGEKSVSTAV